MRQWSKHLGSGSHKAKWTEAEEKGKVISRVVSGHDAWQGHISRDRLGRFSLSLGLHGTDSSGLFVGLSAILSLQYSLIPFLFIFHMKI